MNIQLYLDENIDNLPWPATEDGAYARAYLLPLIKHGTQPFIHNVRTHYMALLIDETIILPISVNNGEYDNSYVCSPYTHYVTYAQEELVVLQQQWLRTLLTGIIASFGLACKWGQFNRVVHVNNWLLSTNLYPDLTNAQTEAVLDFLKARFPRHAIVFRSLNPTCNPSLMRALRQAGSQLVPSRQVYLVQPSDPTAISSKSRWLLKRDHALLAHQGYEVLSGDEILTEDVPRIAELYNQLYLQKYSLSNPMFSERFLRLAVEHKTLHLVVCKKAGRIDAVLGYFCRNGVMTTPVFGYDTTLPQDTGLYRMLSVILFRIAAQNGHLLHESSGAAQFKRNRGAYGEIEYSAVYTRHLPARRRACWSLLTNLLQHIAVPLIRKYNL